MGTFNQDWNYPEVLKDLISLKRLSAIASMRKTHALSVSNRSFFLNEKQLNEQPFRFFFFCVRMLRSSLVDRSDIQLWSLSYHSCELFRDSLHVHS